MNKSTLMNNEWNQMHHPYPCIILRKILSLFICSFHILISQLRPIHTPSHPLSNCKSRSWLTVDILNRTKLHCKTSQCDVHYVAVCVRDNLQASVRVWMSIHTHLMCSWRLFRCEGVHYFFPFFPWEPNPTPHLRNNANWHEDPGITHIVRKRKKNLMAGSSLKLWHILI